MTHASHIQKEKSYVNSCDTILRLWFASGFGLRSEYSFSAVKRKNVEAELEAFVFNTLSLGLCPVSWVKLIFYVSKS